MAKKKIILSKHAEERATQRGVSREDIRRTVDSPTEKEPICKGTQEFKRDVNGRTHSVVVVNEKKNYIIVSTWWN